MESGSISSVMGNVIQFKPRPKRKTIKSDVRGVIVLAPGSKFATFYMSENRFAAIDRDIAFHKDFVPGLFASQS